MPESPAIVDSLFDLTGGRASGIPDVHSVSREGPTWIDSSLSADERQNIEGVRRFWEVWKTLPFDPDVLREFFTADPIVRIGWRGEDVCNGREQAMAAFTEGVQRQVEHDERTDFRFPSLIAKGPVVFHTWTWISSSDRLSYRFERPMAAIFLFRGEKIERWDNYATGKESAPDYAGGVGPDGL
jgi:hypothetical protein